MRRQRIVPTLLLGRRSVAIWTVLVVLALGYVSSVLIRVFPLVPTGAGRAIEIAAGMTGALIVFVVTTIVIAMGRNRRLESELRRSRGAGSPESGTDVTWSTLGEAIRGYNRELHRSRAIKTARIQAQRELIRTILNGIRDRHLIVLSGTGDILFRSAGNAAATASEAEEDAGELRFEPTGAAMAAHLLAGKGSGTVLVNGRTMHFTGVFGRTIAAAETAETTETELLPGLSYIVISEEPITTVAEGSPVPIDSGGSARSMMQRMTRFLTGRR